MFRIWIVIAACLLEVCVAGRVAAQDDEDPLKTAQFRLGALRYTPAFTFAGPGVDTNVFNAYDDPKQDWTARAKPQSDWWLRTGRGLFSASTSVEYLYFATYQSQRSFNTDDRAKFALSLGRLVPFVSGSYLNARQRPNYEIDLRARSVDRGVSIGSEFRLLSRTSVLAWVSRSRLVFDDNDVFLGTSLGAALNRRTDAAHLELRHRLSSLTTFAVQGETRRDRFDEAQFRNADSISVMPGFRFKPLALIAGEAFVGYRSFKPADASVPEFKGLIASAQLVYTLSAVRFAVRFNRDVAYSFEVRQPYYLLTDLSVGVTRMITEGWDVRGTVGRQWLEYRQPVVQASTPPVDTGLQAGASLGRRIGRTLRIGIDVNVVQRRSGLPGLRDYDSLQVGPTVTYGLKQ